MTALPDGRSPARSVLEEERDFFLRSLRDLEAERAAGDIDDVDYRSLRDDYTVRAAEVVRQLGALDGAVLGASPGIEVVVPPSPEEEPEELLGVPRPPAPPAASASPLSTAGGSGGAGSAADGPGLAGDSGDGARVASPWRRRGFIAAAVLIVIGGVLFAVVGMSRPSESAATRVKDLDVAALDAAGSGDYTTAVRDYEAALKIEPADVLTLTGEGELLVDVGGGGSRATLNLGLTRLRSAEIANPSYGPAFGARGIGLYDEGNYPAAIQQLKAYLAETPVAKRAPAIEETLQAALKRLAAKTS